LLQGDLLCSPTVALENPLGCVVQVLFSVLKLLWKKEAILVRECLKALVKEIYGYGYGDGWGLFY
jgi:hypothetical protein